MVCERASECLRDVSDRCASQGWTNAAGDYGKHSQTPAILVVYYGLLAGGGLQRGKLRRGNIRSSTIPSGPYPLRIKWSSAGDDR